MPKYTPILLDRPRSILLQEVTLLCIEGMITVTELVLRTHNVGLTVSSIDISARTITYAYDTGKLDETTKLPVITWIDITV